MAVNGVSGSFLDGLQPLLSFLGANSAAKSVSEGSSPNADTGLRILYRASQRLRMALHSLERALRASISGGRRSIAETAVSSLTLEPISFTTLTSTEQVNATPTSFSPFGPAWKRTSTALATVTGIYSGRDGNALMKVRVITPGQIGGNTAITLRASIDSTIEDITIPAQTPAGTPFTLSNGIVVSFSSGNLERNDEIEVNLYSTVGSVVDPNKAFNGTQSSYPNFEYGRTISTGSFQVNGVVIAVQASDTLNQMLTRITNSSAGVTATFDAGTETVRLTQKAGGPEPIVLSNDTSGFLAATKLSSAVAVPGDAESLEPIASVAKLSGIHSGTSYVNKAAVAIDVQADSISDVVFRINAAAAGVTADLTGGQASFSAPRQFDLADGTGHLFDGLGINEGVYGTGHIHSVQTRSNVVRAVKEFADSISALFEDKSAPAAQVNRLRQSFQDLFAKAFSADGPRFDSKMGLRFDFGETAGRLIEFSTQDQDRLRQALRETPQAVRNLFLQSITSEGDDLIRTLSDRLTALENEIREQAGNTGLLVDLMA